MRVLERFLIIGKIPCAHFGLTILPKNGPFGGFREPPVDLRGLFGPRTKFGIRSSEYLMVRSLLTEITLNSVLEIYRKSHLKFWARLARFQC